jgi:pimeloyl-ACP methyl ester carboxylesterase
MKWIAIAALAVIAIYASICLLLYLLQGKLLYLPVSESRPKDVEALHVPSGDVVLKVWILHGDAKRALLYFGGNGEDVASNIADFNRTLPDRAIFLVNYRGYTGNPGTPSESAFVADAQAVFDTLKPRYEQIAVMGRSLGSGVATALAATRPVEKVILVTPYDSVANVAADHYWWAPVRWLIKDHYDSERRIHDIHVPVLLLIAGRDEVIFRPRSDALVAATPAAVRHVRIVENATHNDIGSYDEYLESITEFLDGP